MPTAARGHDAGAAQTPAFISATRVSRPPIIDGRLDDPVWRAAAIASGFTQSDPDEGEPATEKTTFQVAYDDNALYIAVMCYESEPGKIVSRLSRRDEATERDWVSLNIDPHHDHKTGFYFVVGPSGWQEDGILFNDASFDNTWDGVWSARTAVTVDGWSVECRVPYHALRFSQREAHTWGVFVHRWISRKQERDQWIHMPKGAAGWTSRFGHLTGIREISPAKHVEVMPFALGRALRAPKTAAHPNGRDLATSAGLHLRYGLSPSVSLNATINPDFGQVEADPAVLNLGVFETFLEERRPFFVEGNTAFRAPTPGFAGIDRPARLFHSRRIGRAPGRLHIPDGAREIDRPAASTIIGAAKLSGKTAGRTSFAILDAVTADEYAVIQRTTVEPATGTEHTETSRALIEPLTNYFVGRVQQDVLRDSAVGLLLTAMHSDGLATAYVGSTDAELKWDENAHRVFGRLSASRSGAHNSRKDGYEAVGYISTSSRSVGGQFYADARSPGFDPNDLGFVPRAGQVQGGAHVFARVQSPWALARESDFNFNVWYDGNYDGLTLGRGVNLNSSHTLMNYWRVSFGMTHALGAYDDRATRGGPAMRVPANTRWFANVRSDRRQPWSGSLSAARQRSEEGRTRSAQFSVGLGMRPAPYVQASIDASYSARTDFAQWVQNLDDDGDGSDDRFVFGELDSDVLRLTARLDVALTTTLTLQGYIGPFVAAGDYRAFKELARPKSYDFLPLSERLLSGNPDFIRRSLRGNVVLRWEYQPGSALFLVWTQNRRESAEEDGPVFAPFRGIRESFADEGENIFLLKINYWIGV